MGSYFSRKYYTNEENNENIVNSAEINTPPVLRILKDDPRSASLGIVRTPIQVEATPKRLPKIAFSSSPPIVSSTTEGGDDNDDDDFEVVKKEDLLATGRENNEEQEQLVNENSEVAPEINKLDGGEVELEMNRSGESIKSNKPPVRRYLETNLDDFVTSPLCDTVLWHEKAKHLFDMIQSPTYEVSSTDVSSVSPYTDNSTTLLDVSDFVDDPSAVVTDNDDSFTTANPETMNMSINEWLAQMENEMSRCSVSNNVTPQKSSDMQAVTVSSATYYGNKKLFLTPDAKTSSPAKVRTPLREVKKNLLLESPSLIVKRKQWLSIQEERVKRGLSLSDENTPPPMPPFSTNVPASAPGKMFHRRRITEWDKDSTVLI